MSNRSTDEWNSPKVLLDLRKKLISYANCNRCELTPQDARHLIQVLEAYPTYISIVQTSKHY